MNTPIDESSNPEEATGFMGTVRDIQAADIESLRPILEAWVRDPETGEIIQDEVTNVLSAAEAAANGEGAASFVIAEDTEDHIIGMMGIKPPSDEMLGFVTTDNPAEVINAYVSSEARGTGAGQALLNKLESKARAEGHTELVVNSGPRYKESGWPFWTSAFGEPAAIQKDLYGPGRDAPVWRKSLVDEA